MTNPKLATGRSGYGGRGYRIPNRLDLDGKQIVYPSVTTVLKSSDKPALLQWAVDQAVAYCVANPQTIMVNSDEVAWGKLRWMWARDPDLSIDGPRTHHEGVKNDAAELGTNVHEWIEAEIDGIRDHPVLDSFEAEQMSDEFRNWIAFHEIVSHNAEFTLVNDKLEIAGTADADWSIKCLHDGPTCLGQPAGEFVRALIDLKTSRHTWPEHGMQLAALNSCRRVMIEVPEGYDNALKHEATENGKKVRSWWVEEEAPTFERQAILHLRPKDLTNDGEEIPAFCTLLDLTEDMDLYIDGFVGALALTHMKKKLKDRASARAKALNNGGIN